MTSSSSPKPGRQTTLVVALLIAVCLLIGLVSHTPAHAAPQIPGNGLRDTVPQQGLPPQQNSSADTSKNPDAGDSPADTPKSPEDRSDSRERDAQLRASMRELRRQMAQVQVELARVNTEEVRLEVQKALRESMDQAKISKEAMERALEETRRNLRSIDLEATERAMAETQRNLQKINLETMHRSLAEARRIQQSLREQQESLREMTEEMRKDHLIDKTGDVRIEYKDGKLYINGKEQPPAINEKYKHYFQKGDQTIQFNQNDGTAI